MIEELTIINEKTIDYWTIICLTIGTFLGGIWANESWGRYWGWDPKETWALVSVLVYAFILHMRFIPALRGKYIFNLMTLIGISTIVMTYFGVNYYLSGLHSYAAGDPMPIPVFIYYFVGIVILTGILAKIKQYNNRKREEIITFILLRNKMGLKKITNPKQNASLPFVFEIHKLLKKKFKYVKKSETFFQKNYQNDLWFNYFGTDISYDDQINRKHVNDFKYINIFKKLRSKDKKIFRDRVAFFCSKKIKNSNKVLIIQKTL